MKMKATWIIILILVLCSIICIPAIAISKSDLLASYMSPSNVH